MGHSALAKRVLLIGWDAADWKILSPLIDAGVMPNLSRLVERGAMGNLATLRPALSPILWNSIATGKRPFKHGILGFIEPLADGSGVQPVTSTTRRTKALWNILSQAGKSVHVIGWYASHPAEQVNGICVSNQFAEPIEDTSRGWPLPEGSVYPKSLRPSVADLRVDPRELTGSDLEPMIPKLQSIDWNTDNRPATLARIMARNASVHNVATAILENEAWDFVGVYYDAIDLAGHHFMPFHPPKMANVSQADFELYREVMTNVYRWHDMMLGRLIELAGPDATIMILSDHGFHSDHLRPASARAASEDEAAAWHRQYGILAVAGPNIVRDERIYGATLLDIAPTVLSLLGLPIGNDFDGKPLVRLTDPPMYVERIDSWDAVVEADAPAAQPVRIDPIAAAEAIRQLVDLGYMPAPDDQQQTAIDIASREWRYNLAMSYLDADHPAAALPIVVDLIARYPQSIRLPILQAQILGRLNQIDHCIAVLTKVHAAQPNVAELNLWLGWALFSAGKDDEAISLLNQLQQGDGLASAHSVMLGRIYLKQGLLAEAQTAFLAARQVDPDNEAAHDGLAAVALERGDPSAAVEHALDAVRLMHFFPVAHYRLGVALTRLKEYQRAAQALEVAATMRPGMLDAHRYLAALHSQMLNPEKAMHHRRLARALWDSREQQLAQAANT